MRPRKTSWFTSRMRGWPPLPMACLVVAVLMGAAAAGNAYAPDIYRETRVRSLVSIALPMLVGPNEDVLVATVLTSGLRYGNMTQVNDYEYSYMPDAGKVPTNGTTDSCNYTLSDSKGFTETAAIYVAIAANSLPSASSSEVSTTASMQANIAFTSLIWDIDGDPVYVVRLGTPKYGNATANGTHVIYTPNTHKVPVTETLDPFSYTVTDNITGNVTGLITVRIYANAAPVATGFTVTARMNHSVAFNFSDWAYDQDGDATTVTLHLTPPPKYGNITRLGEGMYVYHAFPGVSEVDLQETFNYTISDGRGANATAALSVVTGINRAPVISDTHAVSTMNNQSVIIAPMLDVDDNDEGDQAFLMVLNFTAPKYGNLSLVGYRTHESTYAYWYRGKNVSDYRYTPHPGLQGTMVDDFNFTVADLSGGYGTGQVRVTLYSPQNCSSDVEGISVSGFLVESSTLYTVDIPECGGTYNWTNSWTQQLGTSTNGMCMTSPPITTGDAYGEHAMEFHCVLPSRKLPCHSQSNPHLIGFSAWNSLGTVVCSAECDVYTKGYTLPESTVISAYDCPECMRCKNNECVETPLGPAEPPEVCCIIKDTSPPCAGLCQNGGNCNGTTGACDCPAGTGWGGPTCEVCPRGWNATCDGCAVGYVGLHCSDCAPGYINNGTSADCIPAACEGKCKNGGNCDPDTNICECTSHWAGTLCEVCPKNWDPASYCNACIKGYTGSSCTDCDSGFEKDSVTGDCLGACMHKGQQCQNGGSCSNATGTCDCPPSTGWSGQMCEVCTRGWNTTGCNVCATGYTGSNCTDCDSGYIKATTGDCTENPYPDPYPTPSPKQGCGLCSNIRALLVCGLDGNTYASPCLASCQGVEVASQGGCAGFVEPLLDLHSVADVDQQAVLDLKKEGYRVLGTARTCGAPDRDGGFEDGGSFNDDTPPGGRRLMQAQPRVWVDYTAKFFEARRIKSSSTKTGNESGALVAVPWDVVPASKVYNVFKTIDNNHSSILKPPKETRVGFMPAEPASAYPYLAIGMLASPGKPPALNWRFCTGFLVQNVGKAYVVTAAHCVYDIKKRMVTHPNKIRYHPQVVRGATKPAAGGNAGLEVESITIPYWYQALSGYEAAGTKLRPVEYNKWDVAVLQLKKPLTAQACHSEDNKYVSCTFGMAFVVGDFKEDFKMAGYGGNEPGNTPEAYHLRVSRPASITLSPRSSVAYTTLSSYGGHSGAPVWIHGSALEETDDLNSKGLPWGVKRFKWPVAGVHKGMCCKNTSSDYAVMMQFTKATLKWIYYAGPQRAVYYVCEMVPNHIWRTVCAVNKP